MSGVEKIIVQKKSFYSDKLRSFLSWSTTKCSMNGTSDKYIRGMLGQILKELHIPSTMIPGILNTIYIRDFDASRLVNKVYDLSKPVFDVLSKDENVRNTSIQSALLSLKHCKTHIDGLNNIQQAGLCVFVQFVLSGGRNDIEGFGVCVDYVDKWKKIDQQYKKKEYQEKLKQQKLECERSITYTVDDDVENEIDVLRNEKETLINDNVLDSWEDNL